MMPTRISIPVADRAIAHHLRDDARFRSEVQLVGGRWQCRRTVAAHAQAAVREAPSGWPDLAIEFSVALGPQLVLSRESRYHMGCVKRPPDKGLYVDR